MGQFSDDGQSWCDGTTWVATAQIVLPQLPMTEFERSGKLNEARGRKRKRDGLGGVRMVPGSTLLNAVAGIAFVVVQYRVLREYRLWTLEQLALATSYLLGPDEAMLAGETTMLGSGFFRFGVTRDLAVVVTPAHVLVFRIDSLDGQPRWVALAARPNDVAMQLHSGPFGFEPTLIISGRNGQCAIRGYQRVFQPEPVLQAWHQAAAGTLNTR